MELWPFHPVHETVFLAFVKNRQVHPGRILPPSIKARTSYKINSHFVLSLLSSAVALLLLYTAWVAFHLQYLASPRNFRNGSLHGWIQTMNSRNVVLLNIVYLNNNKKKGIWWFRIEMIKINDSLFKSTALRGSQRSKEIILVGFVTWLCSGLMETSAPLVPAQWLIK